MIQFSGHTFFRFRESASLFAFCALLSLASAASANAQALNVRINVTSLAPARIRIEAELPSATNVLSFRNAYAGVLGLGERIETLEAIKGSGESIRVRKLAPGEFQSDEKFSRFRYDVNIAEPSRLAQMSHVSWLNREHGVLMLADLLPRSTRDSGSFSSALVSVEVSTGWTAASNIKKEGSQFPVTIPTPRSFLSDPPSMKNDSGLPQQTFQ